MLYKKLNIYHSYISILFRFYKDEDFTNSAISDKILSKSPKDNPIDPFANFGISVEIDSLAYSSNSHFNCSILTKACMFNTRLYRVNFDEASVQGMGISILRGEENIPIDSDTLVTLQKFFEEDCTSHTGMSQTEDNINAVAMKITADIMQHAD